MNLRPEAQNCGCEEVFEHLLEYLDSSLAENAAERIRAHIENCDLCSSDLSTSETVRRLLRRCCVEQAPADLRIKIVERLRTADFDGIATTEITF